MSADPIIALSMIVERTTPERRACATSYQDGSCTCCACDAVHLAKAVAELLDLRRCLESEQWMPNPGTKDNDDWWYQRGASHARRMIVGKIDAALAKVLP